MKMMILPQSFVASIERMEKTPMITKNLPKGIGVRRAFTIVTAI
jgi:hypothetical protein